MMSDRAREVSGKTLALRHTVDVKQPLPQAVITSSLTQSMKNTQVQDHSRLIQLLLIISLTFKYFSAMAESGYTMSRCGVVNLTTT